MPAKWQGMGAEVGLGVLVGAFGVLAAAFVAILLLRAGSLHFALVAPHDAEAVPILRLAAMGMGVLVGVALLICGRDAGAFLPGGLFAPDGPWEIDLATFLGARAFPAREAILRAARAVRGEGTSLVVAATRTAAVGSLFGPLAALVWWRGTARLRAMAAFAVLGFWTAVFVHYAVQFAAWSATRLDFWLFLVALVLFQRWRYRAPALH